MNERGENFHPEVRKFIDKVERKKEEEGRRFVLRDYGHATSNLASALRMHEELGLSQEGQLEMLRQRARKLVEEYGESIIPLLSDELRESLTKEDN